VSASPKAAVLPEPAHEAAKPVDTPPVASRTAVVLAFLAIYVIWGSTYLAIWYAVAAIPPLYTAGFRHAIAGSILLVWAFAKGQRPTWPQIRASIVVGFLFFLVGHGTLHWAETQIPTGLASLLIASEPIWVFLIIVGVLWFGSALGIAVDGVGAMMRDQHDEASRKWATSISLIGLALTFIVAIQSSRGSLNAIRHDLSSYGAGATASGKGTD